MHVAEAAKRATLSDPRHQLKLSAVIAGPSNGGVKSARLDGIFTVPIDSPVPGGYGVLANTETIVNLGNTVTYRMYIFHVPGGGFRIDTFFPGM
jgi:hypothetical protein